MSEITTNLLERNNLLFKLVLIRQEKPYYKDIGHDLTPEGVERSIEKGRILVREGIIDKSKEVILLHSPKPRAKGTLEFIKIGADLDLPIKSVEHIRASDFNDLDKFLARNHDLGFSDEDSAKDHYLNDEFYNHSPHIIETNDSKKKRLYIFLESLINLFEKRELDREIQILAVSHFEIIMHLINDAFGIENFDTYLTPSFGEHLELEAFKTTDENIVRFKIKFRGKVVEVRFDRKNKKVLL